MNYHSIIALATVIVLAGTAQATEDSQLSEEEITNIRVECISTGIADELDDDQMEAFTEECTQQETAARQRFKQQLQQSTDS
jgi:hypothetical protein